MDPRDELRILYRRLKTRHLEATSIHRSEQTRTLLDGLQSLFLDRGFEIARTEDSLKAIHSARTVLLRADSDEDVRIGEFLGFTLADSRTPRQRIRIIAQLNPDALAENAPMDVDTIESIESQIAYLERLLESGAPVLQGFEVRQTMSMANYREPQSGLGHQKFGSLWEAIAFLLEQSDSDAAS